MFSARWQKGISIKVKVVLLVSALRNRLAEAEIEYGEEKVAGDLRKMLVKDLTACRQKYQGKPAYIVIWTTTRGPCLPTLT